MAKVSKTLPVPQNPLILRSHRLMEAFAKSDDERDFYLDRVEGFLVYADLDKAAAELDEFYKELKEYHERYVLIPKLTFYETKKIMEGFVNEKVYDIDTKEKLLDIIQGKEARDQFLEFIYDHHTELEKWQQYYQERSRIRIIEWLRNNQFDFVFEEDLDLAKGMVEKVKKELFEPKPSKDVVSLRKALLAKAKTYYSSEALHPRPKRGRPPKQAVKQEVEVHISVDLYTQVPKAVRPFLFTPDIHNAAAITFSSRFESEEQLLAHKKQQLALDLERDNLDDKLATLRRLSQNWKEPEPVVPFGDDDDEEDDFDDEEEEDFDDEEGVAKKPAKGASKKKAAPAKKKEKAAKADDEVLPKKKGPQKLIAKLKNQFSRGSK